MYRGPDRRVIIPLSLAYVLALLDHVVLWAVLAHIFHTMLVYTELWLNLCEYSYQVELEKDHVILFYFIYFSKYNFLFYVLFPFVRDRLHLHLGLGFLALTPQSLLPPVLYTAWTNSSTSPHNRSGASSAAKWPPRWCWR